MADKQWTAQQKDAIEARGGTVLVSAAAGSGKTAVLVERVIARILDATHPVDADQMLVVTFSNAAALEMKQRLIARIGNLLASNPENLRLQRQQLLLERAQISTIHSFCLELIRSGFQQLGIAANTRVADEKELEVMRLDCAAQAIEQMYAEDKSGSFGRMVELISTSRDDGRVLAALFSLYDFVRAHPFYHSWLEEKLRLYDPGIPLEQTDWGRCILTYAVEAVAHVQAQLSHALSIVREEEAMEKAYGAAVADDLRQAVRLAQVLEEGDWDAIYALLQTLDKKRLGALRGDSPDKERVKGLREDAWKLLGGLRDEQFCATRLQFSDDVLFLRPLIAALFSLTEKFDTIFTDTKRQRTLMDFSDLEQFAIRLLAEQKEDGFRPTVLAHAVRERYAEVLIDEFQDVNAAQEIIFRAVSREENNLFMVGDVKQSIYRFRQARPELFMEKKKRYTPYDGVSWPAKIVLGKNFRSAPEVTAGINLFFRLLMSETIGEIDYNESEELLPGAAFPAMEGRGCELCMVDASGAEAGQDSAVLEAAYVAERIAQMLESGYQVAEGTALRRARPGDFCILLRSPSRKARIYQEALAKLEIPVWSEPKGGFLGNREIAPVISLLRVITNPLLDIELAAALHSPLFSFTADELAEIRQADRSAPLYEAMRAHAAAGDAHCAAFLQTLGGLRRFAADAAADDLLRYLFELTDYPAKMRVMRLGQARYANLMLLVRYASDYHAGGYLGVFGFVRFIDRLCERGGDFAPAVSLSERADVVRVMSIHRSKGLEFPVVFLCDCAKQFNREDLRGVTLLHSEMGFACVRRDFDKMTQYPTVQLQSIRIELERSMLSEELRILYVAMTRAKERLIMTAALKKPKERFAASVFEVDENGKLPPGVTRGAGNYLDWLLMAAARHPAAGELLGEETLPPLPALVDVPLTLRLVRPALEEETPAPSEQPQTAADPALYEKFIENISHYYPFEAQTHIPTKMAVSQISKGMQAAEHRFARRPVFLEKDGLSGAQKGNALHLFMQFSDYEAAARDLPAELERMTSKGFLSREQAEAIDAGKLSAFFRSPLAKRIFAAETVYRELRFLAEAGRELLGEYVDFFDETGRTAIQGVADCVFIENGRAVIVDYKTDGVKTPKELADRYRIQLELYRQVLGESLGVPVGECVLYSFALSCEIILENEERY